ncbi:MAG TPA: hypothetical protein VM577_13960 [Anaerovoracaceae bacterium]|nr:hypothetical protein [Anaerovoracaceae bacterium]
MEQEVSQVKTLIVTSGLVPLAYVVGFFLSFLVFPADEAKRVIMIGSFTLVGTLIAITLTARRIWKGLK